MNNDIAILSPIYMPEESLFDRLVRKVKPRKRKKIDPPPNDLLYAFLFGVSMLIQGFFHFIDSSYAGFIVEAIERIISVVGIVFGILWITEPYSGSGDFMVRYQVYLFVVFSFVFSILCYILAILI